MTNNHDDLDAIRIIVDALEPFSSEDRGRIVRWALEKLGDVAEGTLHSTVVASQAPLSVLGEVSVAPGETPVVRYSKRDIKTFVNEKKPVSDMQFAATVAYYYAFEAPESQQKEEIVSNDLQEASRLIGRERLHNPGQTLRNAAFNGLLDKGTDKGSYKINTVGENLVAITLPSGDNSPKPKPSKKTAKKKAPPKKPVKKKTTKNSRIK